MTPLPMNLKNEVFNRHSKNLELFVRKYKPEFVDYVIGKYMCPICLVLFDQADLNSSLTNYLTIEHIPPESAGWKKKTLTCKQCNNNQGSSMDSFLDESLKSKND